MTTGQRMKERRKQIGISAETVASYLGVSPATIYRYENGGIDKVPGDILAPIAEILQTTPAYLMGWDYDEDVVTQDDLDLMAEISYGRLFAQEDKIPDMSDEAIRIALAFDRADDDHKEIVRSALNKYLKDTAAQDSGTRLA